MTYEWAWIVWVRVFVRVSSYTSCFECRPTVIAMFARIQLNTLSQFQIINYFYETQRCKNTKVYKMILCLLCMIADKKSFRFYVETICFSCSFDMFCIRETANTLAREELGLSEPIMSNLYFWRGEHGKCSKRYNIYILLCHVVLFYLVMCYVMVYVNVSIEKLKNHLRGYCLHLRLSE